MSVRAKPGLSFSRVSVCELVKTMQDFKVAVEQEEARLCLLHPTPSDIPGCLNMFDDYLACGRKRLCYYPSRPKFNILHSNSQPNQKPL
jgi:hypothetical protein